LLHQFTLRLNLCFLGCPTSNQRICVRNFFILVKTHLWWHPDLQTSIRIFLIHCLYSILRNRMLWEWTLRTRPWFRLLSRDHAEIKIYHLLKETYYSEVLDYFFLWVSLFGAMVMTSEVTGKDYVKIKALYLLEPNPFPSMHIHFKRVFFIFLLVSYIENWEKGKPFAVKYIWWRRNILTLILLMWRIYWAPNSIPIYIHSNRFQLFHDSGR
jgi:hypothetical protein